MTAEAQAALQAELERLETDARREIAERIKTAREWGDLKENSEYHDAKNDQAHLETKILRIREQLLAAEVREVETQTEVVGFGSTVEVEDSGGRRTTYTLVSAPEAAPAEGKVSIDSPIGKVLSGARVGDERALADPARRAPPDGSHDRLTKRRTLSASSSVCSSAGKWPPWSSCSQRSTSNTVSTSARGTCTSSFGKSR